MSWNRKLWGIEFTNRTGEKRLIGSMWRTSRAPAYAGEPTRALLFNTREQAREWCRQTNSMYAGRNDVCATWRFRPVWVRETVRKGRQK